jgi:hypothetical protein
MGGKVSGQKLVVIFFILLSTCPRTQRHACVSEAWRKLQDISMKFKITEAFKMFEIITRYFQDS